MTASATSTRKLSWEWQAIALATSGALELLFLLSRFTFHWSFPDAHQPVPFFLLLGFLAVLSFSLFHLPWSFAVLLITAFVPCNLDASRAHLLPVSPIDYVFVAAFIAYVFRIQPKEEWDRLRRAFGTPALVCWGLFLIYSFVCVKVIGGSARNTIRWTEFLFAFYLASLIPKEERLQARSRMAQLLAVLGGICAFWGIIQYLHSHFDFMSVYGPFGQHNSLGGFLSLCFPASLWAACKAKERKLYSVLSFLVLLGLFIGFSRGALLALFVAFPLLGLWTSRPEKRLRSLWYAFAATLVLLSCLAVFPRLRSPNGRNLYWSTGIDIVRHHSWAGVGPGNFVATLSTNLKGSSLDLLNTELLYKHRNDFWQSLHNLYLQIAVEHGLIGFSLWFMGLFFLIGPLFLELRGVQNADFPLRFYFSVSILAYLLHNTVDVLFTNNLETIIAFLVALSYSGVRGDRDIEG